MNYESIQNIDQTFNFLFFARALGDFEYKNVDGKGPTEQLVSPEPEFYIKVKPKYLLIINFILINRINQLTPISNEIKQERDETRDEFLVLACDGVTIHIIIHYLISL